MTGLAIIRQKRTSRVEATSHKGRIVGAVSKGKRDVEVLGSFSN